VIQWRSAVSSADAIIISTPAYLSNVPAILKNALEWLTTSGELSNKAVIAITYTPAPPRGAEAMTSLIWSLKALEARVLAQCPLYQNQLSVADDHSLRGLESIELVDELISLLP
jgi:Predicted flavoprotein